MDDESPSESLLHHTASSCNIRRSQKLDSTPQVDRSHSQRTIAILICTLAYIVISMMEWFINRFNKKSNDPSKWVKGDILFNKSDKKEYMFLTNDSSEFFVDSVDLESGKFRYLSPNSVEFVGNSKLQNTSNEFDGGDRVRLLLNRSYYDNDKTKQLPWGTTGIVQSIEGRKCEVKIWESNEFLLLKKYFLDSLD
ncbi:MAG: hypothetical protein MHMPM18_002033 [Marteilia pararefringens]